MIVFPAIDLKNGQCVRLLRGDMDKATVYGDNPAQQARAWADAGFEWLHLVDLNGAFEGRAVNAEAVEAVLAAVDLPVQLGGGIRTMADIDNWLNKGVRRVILGTVALTEPDLVIKACKAYPGRIVVGIDARGGKVATEGWAEVSEMEALDLARRFEDAGVAAIVYTDIDRDGALEGPNIAATVALAEAIDIPVIASGGVSGADDLRALKAAKTDLEGVIVGRALYDGRVDPRDALEAVK
ncbi:MAG: 1-(5-phosphoribosyl)-5-[(5-phosphoribosylamino)methylideneamino]imidazole-4-carboxamide isomerase [Alphaproteobacteria bacterium]|nr:1-(5-phosphoribosyl)-5-[(5-phosphoribosylamino)methylideneamino]imidazole-4-carboxamide isomerase [Alphaproteobacteria bacterium]